jgi:hypothetical protein
MPSLIQSPQFTFFVGEEEKAVVVHSAAIAATSEYFDALINGGMDEAQKKCARLADVEVQDFVRFVEWAYRGDYTVPKWKEIGDDSEEERREVCVEETLSEAYAEETPREVLREDVPQEACFEVVSPEGYPEGRLDDYPEEVPPPSHSIVRYGSKRKKGKSNILRRYDIVPDPVEYPAVPEHPPVPIPPTPPPPAEDEAPSPSRLTLRMEFEMRDRSLATGPLASILATFTPETNTTATQDFAPVLLAHASLYAFAHARLIAPLQALALDKLHRTLLDFKLFAGRIVDVVELARYVYSADGGVPDRGEDGTLDELRRLVVEYVVCEVDTIGKSEAFVGFLEEGGEFVGDFWKLVGAFVR